jgi:hypothetical protein
LLFGVSHSSIRCAIRQTEKAINRADLDAFDGTIAAVKNYFRHRQRVGNPRVGKHYGVYC